MLVELDIFSGYSIAIAILAIMITVAGILIGLGYALEDRKLKELGRSELYQAIINCAIIAILFVAFSQYGIMTIIINGLTQNVGTQGCNASLGYNAAICFAYNYLIGPSSVTVNGNSYPTLMGSTLSIFTLLTILYATIATISSISINMVVAVGFSGLGVFLSPLHGVINFLAANIFLIIAQAALLKFIALTSVSAILPLGLILRTFYFTRKLGGALIAIAIGFFAVFPLTYVFDAQLLNIYANGSIDQAFSSAGSAVNSSISNAQSVSSSAYGIAQSASTVNSIRYYNPFSAVTSLISGISGTFTSLTNYISDIIAFLIIQVFILPVFSLILTIIFIRELARVLGSEISFGRFDVF
jgi:hypothetical protein